MGNGFHLLISFLFNLSLNLCDNNILEFFWSVI
jgi:hypothetical protein